MNGEASPPAGWLPPRIWGPVAVLLVAAVVALGVFAAMAGGDDEADDQPTFCPPGDPSCTLRQEVHWHADFAIYIDGEQIDFSDPQFISDVDNPISPNAHIHEPRYHIVHVHRESSTWGEFLDSLGMALTDVSITTADGETYMSDETSTLKFYKNGVRVDSLRLSPISDLDRVLITFGDETEDELAEQLASVTDEGCIVSGLCVDREPPGGIEEEPCGGSGLTCS